MSDTRRGSQPPSSTAPPLSSPFSTDDVEETAIRARLEARMFGTAPAPVRIGRYEIGDRIGAGGMGVVYSARDPELGRRVALKVFGGSRAHDPDRRSRLLDEARTLARLSHPNIVQIHEIGEHEDSIFLALELVEGETLATWQRRAGRRWHEILAAYLDAARGLAAAHAIGIVHRDVKPANVVVGSDGRVRVVDFGLAQVSAEPSATSIGASSPSTVPTTHVRAVAGTPAYMSPEQANNLAIDARSDIFSLCLSLFEGLYGLRPFDNRDRRALLERGRIHVRALRAMVPRGSSVPGWVLGLLARGLQPDPRQRFTDMMALIAAFEAAPRRLSHRRWAAGALVGVALGSWGLTVLPAAQPTCPALVDALEGAWDAPRKEAIRAHFLASGLPFAAAAFRQVERSLDAAVIAWSRERQASCVRTRIERSQSEEQFDLAAACLSDHERAIRDVTVRLADGGAAVVTQAHVLVRELGAPERCTSTDALRSGPPPPHTPELRERVATLRAALEEIRFLTVTADFGGARRRADELVESAAIYAPLHAEALFHRAIVAARSGEIDDAESRLREAVAEAEQVRDDALAAAILGELTELATHGRRDLHQARLYAALYEAKLERIDAGEAARAELLDRLGELALVAGQYEAALGHHEAAAGLRASDDLLGRARNLKGTANALAELGRVDASIERLGAARALLTRELGPSHPATAVVEFDLALSLRARPDRTPDDLIRAEELLRDALGVELRHGAEDGLGAARTRVALAEVLGARGELAAASAAIEAALSVFRDRLPPTHDELAGALALAANVYSDGRAWGQAADATAALIRLLRERGSPIPFDLLNNAGELHLLRGDALAATPYFDQALALATLDDPPDPFRMTYALNGRAKVYLLQGDPGLARALFERALVFLAMLAAPDAALRAELWWGTAQALARTGGARPESRRLAADALRLFHEVDPVTPEIAEIEAFLERRR